MVATRPLNRDKPEEKETEHYYFQVDNEEEQVDWVNLLEYNINLFKKKEADYQAQVSFVIIYHLHHLYSHIFPLPLPLGSC